MGLLSREKLLKKDKLETREVDLGGGDIVYVREMTGRERDRFEASMLKRVKDVKGRIDYESNMEDFRARVAVNTVCDKDGNLIFLPDDYKQLSANMSGIKLIKIADAAQKLNKITPEDREEMVKNLQGDQVANSSSDSVKS